MKIAILSCFYPYRGGIAQFNASVFNELSKQYQVKAFNFTRQYPPALFPGKTQYVTEEDMAVKIESESVLDSINPLSWKRTADRINEWAPDLLLTRYWMPFFAPSLGYVAKRMKKSCVCISVTDNIIPHESHFFDKPLTKYFLKSNDAFITLSESVKNDLLQMMPNARCICSPHPLYNHFGERIEKAEARKRLNIDPDKKTLLFFGLIREYKGLDLLLDAFSTLSEDYQLIIAGEPYGSFDKYEKLIRSSSRERDIHCFTRYIKDDEVSLFFSASDVCVLPYRSATQSGISAVSYHFEIPMITTKVGGLKEAIADKNTGLVCDADPKSIAATIRDFFENRNYSDFIEGIRSEKDILSWSNFCSNIINLYSLEKQVKSQ